TATENELIEPGCAAFHASVTTISPPAESAKPKGSLPAGSANTVGALATPAVTAYVSMLLAVLSVTTRAAPPSANRISAAPGVVEPLRGCVELGIGTSPAGSTVNPEICAAASALPALRAYSIVP